MSAHEVTVAQFRAFVKATRYKTDAEGGRKGSGGTGGRTGTGKGDWTWRKNVTWRDPGFQQADSHPVVMVSWRDAQAFCRWLAAKEKRPCRLPTEAEWEYACRAGTVTPFAFGETLSVTHANFDAPPAQPDGAPVARAQGTHPVGSYKPNAWGLYDMHGNVWEWCADWYAKDYYAKSPKDDPAGPTEDEATRHGWGKGRVLRGGSWINGAYFARTVCRGQGNPTNRYGSTGFRVVCPERPK